MSQIKTHLPIEHILIDLDVGSKKRLFEHVGQVIEQSRQIPRARIFDCLFDREKLGSTGLGHGVAIPHGRIKALKETTVAFVRLKDGVSFDSPDGKPVRIVFVMLAPEHANEQHLNLLAELAQMLSDEGLRSSLLNAATREAAHEIISNWALPFGEAA